MTFPESLMTPLTCTFLTHTHRLSHPRWPTGDLRMLSWQPFSNTSVCVSILECWRQTAHASCLCMSVSVVWSVLKAIFHQRRNHWPHFTLTVLSSKKSVCESRRRRMRRKSGGGGGLRGMGNECNVWKTTQSISFISCLRRNLMSLSIFISSC